MKHLALVAFHFPPFAASSSVQRVLAFSTELQKYGWRITVVTPDASVHDSGPGAEPVPEGVTVVRTRALDTRKHFSLLGRYPNRLAIPDRWHWWPKLGAGKALRALKEDRPDVILATYPIPSTLVMGMKLAKALNVPFVADFRDPVIDHDTTHTGKMLEVRSRIEADAAQTCAMALCTTPGTVQLYTERYGTPEKWRLLPNGFRESTFANAQPAPRSTGSRKLLLHSGVVYPSERDPRDLFAAVATLKKAGRLGAADLCIRLRASGHDALFKPVVEQMDIADIVEFAPPLPYREALAEMLSADALLIMQASNCNAQVPAKIYEYLRAKRPILALTDPVGDTAKVLGDAACAQVVPLDDAQKIAATLPGFLQQLPTFEERVFDDHALRAYSREGQCEQLALWLDALMGKALS